MRWRIRFWLPLGLLVLVAGLSSQLAFSGRLVTAQPGDAMAIDMNPATPEVDNSATEPLGISFDVSINVTSAATAYDTYGFSLVWDPTKISFVSGTHLNPDGLTTCFPFQPTAGNVVTACSGPGLETTFTGQVDRVTLQCLASGTYSLHLVTVDEDPIFGTATYFAGAAVNTTLTDAQVTCGEGGAAPTATPEEGAGWSTGAYAALAGGLAALLAVSAGAWYAWRRWLR
jgi:hypothetical protein